MLLWILIGAYLLFLSFWLFRYPEKNKEVFPLLVLLGILLIGVSGFRHYSVGSDAISYKSIFENNRLVAPSLMELFSSRFEPGFIWINQFLRLFTDNYTVLFLTYAIPTVTIWLYISYRYSQNIFFTLFLYLTAGIYTYALSNIRQGLAVVIILLAFDFFVRSYRLLPVLLTGLACLFHTTAFVFLLIYPLSAIRFTKRSLILTGVAVLVILPFIRTIAVATMGTLSKYESYIGGVNGQASLKFSTIMLATLLILVFLLGEYLLRGKKLSTVENLIRNLFILGMFFSILGTQTALLGRFSLYFTSFAILYIPMFISKISDKKQQMFWTYGVVIGYSLFFFIPLIWRPEWSSAAVYRNVIVDWLLGQ